MCWRRINSWNDGVVPLSKCNVTAKECRRLLAGDNRMVIKVDAETYGRLQAVSYRFLLLLNLNGCVVSVGLFVCVGGE